MKSIEKIGVTGYAFKNYVCQELSFAEFSGLRSCAEVRTKLSEAEFKVNGGTPL